MQCKSANQAILQMFSYRGFIHIPNGAELGGATGAMAPLVFWSRSLKKSQKVLKSKSRSLKWHQLVLPSLGANDYIHEFINWESHTLF